MVWHKIRFYLGMFAILNLPLCTPETEAIYKSVYSAVYMTYDELRSSFHFDTTTQAPIQKAGKIYQYDHYLFVNEIQKGVHVLDVVDPTNPVKIGFINIPGNADIAIKNNVMYADSFVDLVVIDISPLLATPSGAPVEITRINDMFPYPTYYAEAQALIATGLEYTDPAVIFDAIDEAKGIVVDWYYSHEEEIKQAVNDVMNFSCNNYLLLDYAVMEAGSIGATTGTGGSLARFTIYQNGINDYLYTLNHTDLNIVDITNEISPAFLNSFIVGFEIQSIFSYGTRLFISSAAEISIYDVSTNPVSPSFVSAYTYSAGCNGPVYPFGNYLYGTVNISGVNSGCIGQNALQVIDLANISSVTLPVIVNSITTVQDPHGLGIEPTSSTLAVCDGIYGIKLFNITVPYTPFMILPGIPSPTDFDAGGDPVHDIIIIPPAAYVVGDKGIYIYNTTGISTGTMTLQGSYQIVP